jgi:hypothetical protein
MSDSLMTQRQALLLEHFSRRDFATALAIAEEMEILGETNPLQVVILAHLGVLTGSQAAFHLGLSTLDRLPRDLATQSALLNYDHDLIAAHACGALTRGELDQILQLLEISRRANPAIGEIFTSAVDEALRRPANPSLPVTFPSRARAYQSLPPPPKAETRRVSLFVTEFFFGPGSRRHDIGPRIKRAFDRSNWPCDMFHTGYIGNEIIHWQADEFYQKMGQNQPDLILLDSFNIAPAEFAMAAARLRRDNPNIRFVLLIFDPWLGHLFERIRPLAEMVDLVWAPFPSAPLLAEPIFRNKLYFSTFPVGIDYDELRHQPRLRRAAFQGAIEWYNYSRAYWIAMLERAKAPVTALVTQHVDDGLGAIESYRKYIETFLIYDSQLNFALRRDGSRLATGRAFEVIHCGGCLFQERTEDLDYYFTPQEHYFCFKTFDELMDLLKLAETEPERIQAVAAKGQAYYRAHFDDRLIIDGLGRMAFG